MDKNLKIWMDGKIVHSKDAKIHVLTHTLHYGGGVFEGIRFYNTKHGRAVFRLPDHLNRLFYSASRLSMKIPYSRIQLASAIKQVIIANKFKQGYIRPIVFFGDEQLGVYPLNCKVHVAIAAFPWDEYLGSKPITVKISSFIRIHPKSSYTDAKICGHYVNSILANLEAKKAKYDEAVLLDYRGNVSEGTGENIFIVKNNVLMTPSTGNILKGITRASILQIAKDQKIPAKELKIGKKALYSADESFFSGTAAQIVAIKSFDRRSVGIGKMGPLTKKLAAFFLKTVHGEIPKYKKWLTFIDRPTR